MRTAGPGGWVGLGGGDGDANGRRRHPSANHGTDPLDLQLSFIPGLSHLTSLALPGLNLSLASVPDLAALTALQRLELQGNALRSLPDSFLQQQSLLTYGVHADVLLQLQQLMQLLMQLMRLWLHPLRPLPLPALLLSPPPCTCPRLPLDKRNN